MRLLATVTFRPNQLRAYFMPLLEIPEVEEVVLVTDAEPAPLPKLRAVVPTPTARRLFGRAGSKLVLTTWLARKLRPDWVVSYSIVPHGVNGLVAARASGSRALYHMIGGPGEWQGGGWQADNALLSRLPRPSRRVEAALLAAIKRCDLVSTMGTSARETLIDAGVRPERVVAIPASIDVERFSPPPPDAERDYDLVIAGDLIERKRVSDFIDVVAELRRRRPRVRAAIVGHGPERAALDERVARLGLEEAVDFLGVREDIEHVYRSSRVYVMTSRLEGLSIAMTEAMACGLPAVVTDVGDHRDLVREGVNGHLLRVGDVGGFADRIAALLDDPGRWAATAEAAHRSAADHSSVARVSAVYRELLVGRAR